MKEITFKYIKLSEKHIPTGNVRHFFQGRQVTDFKELKIIKYENDPGYLIIYFDSKGEEISDTYHESLEEALDYANWEFNVSQSEWQDVRIERDITPKKFPKL